MIHTPVPAEALLVLGATARSVVEELIAERQAAARLLEAGLEPSRSLLLTGPPGVGKTLTAHHVAARLDLPLLTVDLASVMSSYLGQTGRNLHTALQAAQAQECVVFLDEFDALAKRRDDDSDVGELKRLVTVLLQQLDQWPTSGLLIAATNHPELLDRAVHRRFDLTAHLEPPTLSERTTLVRQLPVLSRIHLSEEAVHLLALATEGQSHAEIEAWVTRLVRRAVLTNLDGQALHKTLVEHSAALLREQATGNVEVRRMLASVASTELGMSRRKIADWLGVSHPTISKDITTYQNRRTQQDLTRSIPSDTSVTAGATMSTGVA